MVNAYWSPLFGRTVIVPLNVPAETTAGFAVTVNVAGALEPELVTVSHGESEVAVNGTILPMPSALTCIVCEGGADPPLDPLKVSDVGVTCRTGLLVITNCTGSVITLACPEIAIRTVVV